MAVGGGWGRAGEAGLVWFGVVEGGGGVKWSVVVELENGGR